MGSVRPGFDDFDPLGSPLPVAAAIANLEIIRKDKLADAPRAWARSSSPELQRIRQKHPLVLGCLQGKGLVAGIQVVKPGSGNRIPDMATKINVACLQKGLLMFAPVGWRASA